MNSKKKTNEVSKPMSCMFTTKTLKIDSMWLLPFSFFHSTHAYVRCLKMKRNIFSIGEGKKFNEKTPRNQFGMPLDERKSERTSKQMKDRKSCCALGIIPFDPVLSLNPSAQLPHPWKKVAFIRTFRVKNVDFWHWSYQLIACHSISNFEAEFSVFTLNFSYVGQNRPLS